MQDFVFMNPTRIVFGKGAQSQVAAQVRLYGGAKVLIHYGGGSAQRSGLLDQVRASLKDAGIGFVELGGVVPNPRVSLVRKAIDMCKGEGVDFILAVGGGSVIDSAKAAAMGACYDGDVWDLYAKTAQPQGALPIGVVLTIPAAGSESSDSSVITNEALCHKRSCDSEAIYPRFAILNPELTYTMPKYQIAAGCVDIMAHVMERYFTNEPNTGVSDRMAEALLRNMIVNAPLALENPTDYAVRAEIMWTGTLAHNNLIGCGRAADWSSHPIEHELSAQYDIAHGAGLAIIYPAFMKYVYKRKLNAFVRFATQVWGVEYDRDNPEATALNGILRLEAFFRRLGMPTRFAQANLPVTDVRQLAQRCDRNETGMVGHFLPLDTDDVEAIYRLAF